MGAAVWQFHHIGTSQNLWFKLQEALQRKAVEKTLRSLSTQVTTCFHSGKKRQKCFGGSLHWTPSTQRTLCGKGEKSSKGTWWHRKNDRSLVQSPAIAELSILSMLLQNSSAAGLARQTRSFISASVKSFVLFSFLCLCAWVMCWNSTLSP